MTPSHGKIYSCKRFSKLITRKSFFKTSPSNLRRLGSDLTHLPFSRFVRSDQILTSTGIKFLLKFLQQDQLILISLQKRNTFIKSTSNITSNKTSNSFIHNFLTFIFYF